MREHAEGRRSPEVKEHGGHHDGPEYRRESLRRRLIPNFDLNDPRDLSILYSDEEWEAMSEDEQVQAMNDLWRKFLRQRCLRAGIYGKAISPSRPDWNPESLRADETYYWRWIEECPGDGYQLRPQGRTRHRDECRMRWHIPVMSRTDGYGSRNGSG